MGIAGRLARLRVLKRGHGYVEVGLYVPYKKVIVIVDLLITLLRSTHEPPSMFEGRGK